MKYLDLSWWQRTVLPLAALVLNGLVASAAHGLQQEPTVKYVAAGDADSTGIGFLADGKSLFIGGCQPIDLTLRSMSPGCRYPADVRWGTISPDGSLLLATTLNAKTRQSRSMQIDALSGRILSTRKGIHFAPPIAVHPSNTYWVSVAAAAVASASEAVTVVDRSWKTRKDRIYAETQRIFSLEFDAAGNVLVVNGGSVDGVRLDTRTWNTASSPTKQPPEGTLQVSPDGRFGVRQQGQKLAVFEVASLHQVIEIDLDTTRSEPETAFSANSTLFAAKGYISKDGQRKFGFALVTLQ